MRWVFFNETVDYYRAPCIDPGEGVGLEHAIALNELQNSSYIAKTSVLAAQICMHVRFFQKIY